MALFPVRSPDAARRGGGLAAIRARLDERRALEVAFGARVVVAYGTRAVNHKAEGTGRSVD
jgi:hypothetical protein